MVKIVMAMIQTGKVPYIYACITKSLKRTQLSPNHASRTDRDYEISSMLPGKE